MKDQTDTQTIEIFPAPKKRGRPSTGKARTGAQRQQDLRWRREHGIGGKYERKLDLYITSQERSGLSRLASYYGKTERELLEKMISEAENSILKTLDVTSPQWHMYFDKTLHVTTKEEQGA